MAFAVAYLLLFARITSAASVFYPPVAVYANSAAWRTDLIVSSAEPVTVYYSNCVIAPQPSVTLGANGTAIVRDFGEEQCGGLSLGYATIPTPADVVTDFYFDDGVTRSHFAVPLLRKGVPFGERGVISRVVNDGAQGTFLVFVNTGPAATSLVLTVRDGADAVVGMESFILPTGVTAYTLKTPLAIGRIEILNGALIGSPSIQPSTIYGFAAVGPQSGASQRVEVIE
jgi:hypothetical protein